MASSVRELVAHCQNEIAKGEVSPARATVLLNQLSALSGNIESAIVAAEMAYNRRYAVLLDEHGKANRAEVIAKTTSEYEDLRERKVWLALVEKLIASLKYTLKVWEIDARLTR